MTNLRYPNSQRIFQSITKLKTEKLKYGRYWLQTNPFWSEKSICFHSIKPCTFDPNTPKASRTLISEASNTNAKINWQQRQRRISISLDEFLKRILTRSKSRYHWNRRLEDLQKRKQWFLFFFLCSRERSMKSNWNGKWKAIKWKRTS